MNWKLTHTDPATTIRTYTQDQTGSQCQTKRIHTDNAGREWYGFVDMFKIPYLRIAFSQSISNLFKTNLTVQDLQKWFAEEKAILKSNDKEKYEKLYALVLEKETLTNSLVDPLRQHTALATVYVLRPDEPVDYFSFEECVKKMADWALLPESVAFFLSWHTEAIQRYGSSLSALSQIASSLQRPAQ